MTKTVICRALTLIYFCLQMILSSIVVSTRLKTVLCYRMTLIPCLNGQNIGCYPLNVSKCKALHIGSTPYTGNHTLDGGAIGKFL